MAGKYSPNQKINKFNQSIINDRKPVAKRSIAAHKKGLIKGYGAKHARTWGYN